MGRVCTVCTHPDREDIEVAIVRRVPYRTISDQYALSKTALLRHASTHLPAALARAVEAEGEVSAATILAQVNELRDAALSILRDAQEDRAAALRVATTPGDVDLEAIVRSMRADGATALAAIREARGCVELLAKVAGQLQAAPTVNFLVSPEWASVQAAILGALSDHPLARVAVAGALKQIEGPRADAA